MFFDTLYYMSIGAVVLCMTLFNFRSTFFRNDVHSLLRYDLRVDISVNDNDEEPDTEGWSILNAFTSARADESGGLEAERTTRATVGQKALEFCTDENDNRDENLDSFDVSGLKMCFHRVDNKLTNSHPEKLSNSWCKDMPGFGNSNRSITIM